MDSHRDVKSTTQLEIESFSVDKYFNYVGLSNFNPSQNSLEDLTTIIKYHLNKFIYQNIELYEAGRIAQSSERKVSSLDIDPLFTKMLAANGGYCFQHLELLYAVLDRTGFSVDRLLGKIILQSRAHFNPKTHIDAKTHELLITHVNDIPYIVDVGMANMSLRAPLELKEGEVLINEDQYRLSKDDNLWSLDTKSPGINEWLCLYQFFNSPVKYEDITHALNNLVFTDKFIPIRDEWFYVAKTTAEKRKHVIWHVNNGSGYGLFKSVKANSNTESKTQSFNDFKETYDFAKKNLGSRKDRNCVVFVRFNTN